MNSFGDLVLLNLHQCLDPPEGTNFVPFYRQFTMNRTNFLGTLLATPLVTPAMKLSTFTRLTDGLARSARMPVLFIGHGHPMNALLDNEFTQSLTRLGQSLDRPQAVLVVSAHWLTRGTQVSLNPKPQAIYDFGNFHPDLFRLRYDAPGAAQIARTLKEHLTLTAVQETDQMGLDHGAWTVLRYIFPKADVPVFQLSIDIHQPESFHYALAGQLDYLRDRGVLILASGNIVHNLSRLDWTNINAKPYDWTIDFDQLVKQNLEKGEHTPLINFRRLGQSALLSVPENDHYLPMLYALGLQGRDEPITQLYEGYQFGSISMRCFRIG